MAFWMIKKHNVDVSFFKESIQMTLKIIKDSLMRTNIFFHCIYIYILLYMYFRDLQIYKNMDENPVLWQILDLYAASKLAMIDCNLRSDSTK